MKSLELFFIAVFIMLLAGCEAKENRFEQPDDNTVIGYSNNRLTTYYYDIASCETGLGDLVADAMKFLGGVDAQIGLINAGSVRRRDRSDPTWLEPGDITMGQMILVFPFDNPEARTPSTIALISLSGSTLKAIFENSFSRMAIDGSSGVSFGRFLQVSGIQVFADVRKSIGSRVTKMILTDTGEVIDPSDAVIIYKVAIPLKYIKDTPGYKDFDDYWDIFEQGINIIDTEIFIFDAAIDYIKSISPISEYSDPADCTAVENRIVITHN